MWPRDNSIFADVSNADCGPTLNAKHTFSASSICELQASSICERMTPSANLTYTDAVFDLDKTKSVLRAGPPLRLAVLFGSLATERARPDSDVDIAIVPVDAALPLKLELELAGRLSLALGREVDLVRLDRASTLLRWEIARDGLLLVAEPKWEWVRFRANAASEHADFADALQRAAELFRRRIAGSIS